MSEPLDLRKKKRKSTSCSTETTPDSSEDREFLQANDVLPIVNKSRTRLTYEEKKKIVEESYRLGAKIVCENYKIGLRTLRDWKNMKEKITENSKKYGSLKKVPKPKVEKMDLALTTWLDSACDNSVPATGIIVREKAKELNKEMGGSNSFAASEGWLHRFKKRQEIRSLKFTGNLHVLKLFFK